jgi:hypothetical protein
METPRLRWKCQPDGDTDILLIFLENLRRSYYREDKKLIYFFLNSKSPITGIDKCNSDK